MNYPKTEKGLRNKIKSYRKAMTDEKREWGCFNDGGGLRYTLFYLYFLLDDKTLSKRYITFFTKNFDDDCGDPISDLCWALMLFRRGELKEAQSKLGEVMLSNLYILPLILDRTVEEYDIWHSSNMSSTEWLNYIPKQVRAAITAEDKKWLEMCFESKLFSSMREQYIDIYTQLNSKNSRAKHIFLLDQARNIEYTLGVSSSTLDVEPEIRIYVTKESDDEWAEESIEKPSQTTDPNHSQQEIPSHLDPRFEQLLEMMGFSLDDDGIEAFIRDEFHTGQKSFEKMIVRCFDDRIQRLYSAYEDEFNQCVQKVWDKVESDYNRFSDYNAGLMRHEALKGIAAQLLWIREIDYSGLSTVDAPQDKLKEIGHITSLLANCVSTFNGNELVTKEQVDLNLPFLKSLVDELKTKMNKLITKLRKNK